MFDLSAGRFDKPIKLSSSTLLNERCIAISRSKQYIYFHSKPKAIIVLDVPNNKKYKLSQHKDDELKDLLLFDQNSELLASVTFKTRHQDGNYRVDVWNITEEKLLYQIDYPHNVSKLAADTAGDNLAMVDAKGTMRVLDIKTQHFHGAVQLREPISFLSFCLDGMAVVAAGAGHIFCIDIFSDKIILRKKVDKTVLYCKVDKNFVTAMFEDGSLRQWSASVSLRSNT